MMISIKSSCFASCTSKGLIVFWEERWWNKLSIRPRPPWESCSLQTPWVSLPRRRDTSLRNMAAWSQGPADRSVSLEGISPHHRLPTSKLPSFQAAKPSKSPGLGVFVQSFLMGPLFRLPSGRSFCQVSMQAHCFSDAGIGPPEGSNFLAIQGLNNCFQCFQVANWDSRDRPTSSHECRKPHKGKSKQVQ